MSSSEEYSFHDSNESQGSASPSVDAGKEMVLGQKAKERKPKHLARSSNKTSLSALPHCQFAAEEI